ncbi:MAG TPA: hypothetical protein VFM38_07345, partial [Candidatus Limnocylindrales bacterium]|nr:hypothetical protein [Candidatus Limnocylindrales bacterium]
MRDRNVEAVQPGSARASGGAVGARYTLARNLIAIVTWGLVVAFVIQVYLAGIGVFRGNFELHRNVGY